MSCTHSDYQQALAAVFYSNIKANSFEHISYLYCFHSKFSRLKQCQGSSNEFCELAFESFSNASGKKIHEKH